MNVQKILILSIIWLGLFGVFTTVEATILNFQGGSLTGDLTLNGDHQLAVDKTLNLNGHTLTVTGSFYQLNGSSVHISTGKLIVNGDYKVGTWNGYSSDTYLIMTSANDRVLVYGNFEMNSQNDHTNYLTAGTLEIKGDFNQTSPSTYPDSVSNFNATNTHTVKFSGDTLQGVRFYNPTESGFSRIEFINTQMRYHSNLRGLTLYSDLTIPMYDEANYSDSFRFIDEMDLNGYTLTIDCDLNQSDTSIMNINGGSLIINGDYHVGTWNGYSTDSYLSMTSANDHVLVTGDFEMNSQNDHTDYLTNGTLELKGDFNQSSSSTSQSCMLRSAFISR